MSNPNDPADFSKLRSIEPNNIDPNLAPPTAWEQIRRNFSLLIEVTKAKPVGETLCLKEAFILGKKRGTFLASSCSIFQFDSWHPTNSFIDLHRFFPPDIISTKRNANIIVALFKNKFPVFFSIFSRCHSTFLGESTEMTKNFVYFQRFSHGRLGRTAISSINLTLK